MKTLQYYLASALCLFLLPACTERDDLSAKSPAGPTIETLTSSFDEHGDPPKDKPRDRDNWKPVAPR